MNENDQKPIFVAPPDPEIDALATCLKALLPLDQGARSRVLEYLDDRLQLKCDEVVWEKGGPVKPVGLDDAVWRDLDPERPA